MSLKIEIDYFFGGLLLCGSTGTVFGPGFGLSGFFLGTGEGFVLLCGFIGIVFFVIALILCFKYKTSAAKL
jgi:hypothetical protein